MKFILASIFLIPAFLSAKVWEIEPSHSAAKFKVRHLTISNVYGQITGAKGTLDLNDKDMAKSKLEVTLDPSTINTNDAKRDTHLKSPDFFDTKAHPTISFKSKKFEKASDGKWKIVGELTMHGKTKEVTLTNAEITPEIKDAWGNMRRGFSAETSIDRKDFGITWNKVLDNGGLTVSDKVDINVEAEFLPKESKS